MDLEIRAHGSLDQRSLTICNGLDLVNVNYSNFIAADEKIAKVIDSKIVGLI